MTHRHTATESFSNFHVLAGYRDALCLRHKLKRNSSWLNLEHTPYSDQDRLQWCFFSVPEEERNGVRLPQKLLLCFRWRIAQRFVRWVSAGNLGGDTVTGSDSILDGSDQGQRDLDRDTPSVCLNRCVCWCVWHRQRVWIFALNVVF